MEFHKVRVGEFEGPLNLLLSLIEEEKMDISRVSLAHVTNQYLEILRGLSNASPESIAEFLVVAGKLILIKSQRLMPQIKLTEEEEKGILSLEEQLRLYRIYSERSKVLQKLWTGKSFSFAREGFLGIAVSFYPPQSMKIEDMASYLNNVIRTLPVMEKTREEVVARVVSLEERIGEIRDRIKKAVETSFKEAITGASRADVVISFLAVLELVRQQIVSVEQRESFQDIIIRNKHDGNNE